VAQGSSHESAEGVFIWNITDETGLDQLLVSHEQYVDEAQGYQTAVEDTLQVSTISDTNSVSASDHTISQSSSEPAKEVTRNVGSVPVPANNSAVQIGSTSAGRSVTDGTPPTPSNTDLLLMLKTGFEELVIKHLDTDVREAYSKQKEVEDQKEFRAIKAATEKRVLKILVSHVPKGKIPNIEFFRDVVSILADNYKYIYGIDHLKEVAPGEWVRKFPFRGTGGPGGIKSLPKILQQSFRRLRDVDSSHGHSSGQPGGSVPETKKDRKRKAHVYGVDQVKFYAAPKLSKEEMLELLNQHLRSYEEREQVFAANRETVQDILTGSAQVFDTLSCFFTDDRHVQLHFQWLTESSITGTINAQVTQQFEFLHKVLKRWIPTHDFKRRTEAAEVKSAEFNGSPVPLQICLIRELNEYWHKKRSGLIRFQDEEESSSSPHIVCVESTGGLRFSVHAEKRAVFCDLTFTDAVAAFFHISFVCNMKYPDDGEAVAIWLQRKVAGIVGKGNLCKLSCGLVFGDRSIIR
jgi:hypothetical protein